MLRVSTIAICLLVVSGVVDSLFFPDLGGGGGAGGCCGGGGGGLGNAFGGSSFGGSPFGGSGYGSNYGGYGSNYGGNYGSNYGGYGVGQYYGGQQSYAPVYTQNYAPQPTGAGGEQKQSYHQLLAGGKYIIRSKIYQPVIRRTTVELIPQQGTVSRPYSTEYVPSSGYAAPAAPAYGSGYSTGGGYGGGGAY